MTRNIKKAISDYDKQYEKTGRGEFYHSDFEQLRELSTMDGCMMPDTVELIHNSLKAGYIIGYRAAIRSK